VEENKPQNREDSDEINLLDLLIVLAKHKKLIIGGTLGAGIVMAVISLIMTPVYLAETKIIIPQSAPSLSMQLMNQLGPIADMAGSTKTPNDLYIELIKSNPVCDRIINRFNLMKAYRSETLYDARVTLRTKIKIAQNKKSGVITVGVMDKDPKMCAAMANAFIDDFRNVNKELALTEASQRRLFFEEQLKEAKESLAKTEEAMKTFQEKTGAIKIDAQAAAVIEGISQLRAQIAAKEVQLRVMRTYSTPRNPDILRVEEEIRGMREQMKLLESKGEGDSFIVPSGSLPSANALYVRHMRDLKFNETLYELLLGQYQTAKLDEARNAVVVQVIEKAEPPEKKIKPKRRNMVLFALILGFFSTLAITSFIEFRDRASRDPECVEKMRMLKEYSGLK